MTSARLSLAVAALMLVFASGPARAVDGVAIEAGRGEGTNMARVGVQWHWKSRWFQGQNWHLGGYWDLALGQWRHSSPPGYNENITEIGLTPVFRWQCNDLQGPYLEAAIGFHLLSHTSLRDKRFSTAIQFGEHIGAGFRFGAKGEFDLGYRFQHLSNGGIKRPNDGIDLHQVRFQYHF